MKQQYQRIKRGIGLVAVTILLLAMCGCDLIPTEQPPEKADTDYPVFVGSLTLTEAPQRVIVLSPVISGWIEDLGLTNTVIGCVSEGMSEAFSRASDIGSTLSPDLEAIASLQPDLILGQTPTALTEEFVRINHIPYLTINTAASTTELNSRYHTLATALDGAIQGAKRAKTQHAILLEKLDAVTEMVGIPEVSYSTLFITTAYGHVATGDTLLHELMTKAGATNIAKAGTNWQMPSYNGNIQVIFCPASIKDAVMASDAYKNTHAVKNNRVYAIDDALLSRQGNNLVALTEQMASTLYPELFETTTADTTDM